MTPTGETAARTRKRADAERSISAIIDAARELFSSGTIPSMSEIAAAAGVGRVTLYSHFASREAVLEAVVERSLQDATAVLDGLEFGREPADTELAKAVRASWHVLDRHRRIRDVALAELGADRVEEHHRRASEWLERLIARGCDTGRFRSDLPHSWLVAVFYGVLHTAADEVNAGRLSAHAAPDVVVATVLSAFGATSSQHARLG